MDPTPTPAPPPPGPNPTRPEPGASRAQRRLPLLIGLSGSGLALLLVCGLLAAFLVGGDPDGPPLAPPDPALVERAAVATDLGEAAATLLATPGLRYRGWFTDGRRRIALDAQVTNEGSTAATLTVDRRRLQLLDLGDRTFVKAPKEYWRAAGAPADSVGTYAAHWVKVAPDQFGFDLGDALAPARFADALAPGIVDGDERADDSMPVRGPPSTIAGVRAEPVIASGVAVYLSTTAPRRVVRVAHHAGGSGGGFRTAHDAVGRDGSVSRQAVTSHDGTPAGRDQAARLRAAAPDRFQFDIERLTDRQTDELFRALDRRIRELRDSIDSQVQFTLDGAIALSPCTSSGCRANVTINNRVNAGSPYLAVNRPVRAAVTIRMTLDGRPISTCRANRTMKPNGNASMSCWARYRLPPSRDPQTHYVEAQYSAVARALVESDIAALAGDLAQEMRRNQAARRTTPPSDTAPGTTAPSPPATGSPTGPGPGDQRPTGPPPSLSARVQQLKSRVEQLARRACQEIVRLPGESPRAWGIRVHTRLSELISLEPGGQLHTDIGYRNRAIQEKVYNPIQGRWVWPNNTKVPDVVIGPDPLRPELLLDLRTGRSGIRKSWYDALVKNLPRGYTTVPVLTVRC